MTRTDYAALVLLLLLMSASDAWAYIEPGVGSYLFQLVIAGGLAGLYTARKYWSTLKTTWRSKFGGRRHPVSSPPDGVD